VINNLWNTRINFYYSRAVRCMVVRQWLILYIFFIDSCWGCLLEGILGALSHSSEGDTYFLRRVEKGIILNLIRFLLYKILIALYHISFTIP
jgi:hypothetical protein